MKNLLNFSKVERSLQGEFKTLFQYVDVKTSALAYRMGLQGSFHFYFIFILFAFMLTDLSSLKFPSILYGPPHLIAESVLSTLMLAQGPNIL